MHPEGTARRVSWPYVEDKSYLWTWLFVIPLVAYTLWQVLYVLIVNILRRQRLLRDPEVMTSYRFVDSLSLSSHLFHKNQSAYSHTHNHKKNDIVYSICYSFQSAFLKSFVL